MSEFSFPCPHCQQPLLADDEARTRQITCPACSQPLSIPGGNDHYAAPPGRSPGHTPEPTFYPAFVKGWFITDLVMCSLRAVIVIFSLIAMATMPEAFKQLGTTLPTLDLLSQATIFACGLSANILLLRRQSTGLPLAYIACGAVIIHVIVSIYTIIAVQVSGMSGAEKIGAVIGGAFTITIRLGLLAFYVIALRKAASILQGNARV